MKVAIVVGHKLSSKGKSNTSGISEFSYNLIVSELLPYTTFYFDDSLDYYDGCQKLKAQLDGFDLVLHLHFNGFDDEVSGCEALYWHSNELGKSLADEYTKQISASYNIRNRGPKTISNKSQRGYWAVQSAPCTALILEPFFGTNESDTKKFSDFGKYAKEIIKFVDKWQRQQIT